MRRIRIDESVCVRNLGERVTHCAVVTCIPQPHGNASSPLQMTLLRLESAEKERTGRQWCADQKREFQPWLEEESRAWKEQMPTEGAARALEEEKLFPRAHG